MNEENRFSRALFRAHLFFSTPAMNNKTFAIEKKTRDPRKEKKKCEAADIFNGEQFDLHNYIVFRLSACCSLNKIIYSFCYQVALLLFSMVICII
jgi:hypothetical protein